MDSFTTIEARSKEEYSVEDHVSVNASPDISPLDAQFSTPDPMGAIMQKTSEKSYEFITSSHTRSRSMAHELPDSLRPATPRPEHQRSRSTAPDDDTRLHARYDSRSASVSRADPSSRPTSRSPKPQPSAEAKARWEMLAALARSSRSDQNPEDEQDHEKPPESAIEREEIIKRAWSEHEVRKTEEITSGHGPLDMPAPEEYMAAEHKELMASRASSDGKIPKRLVHDANRSSHGSIDDCRANPKRKETEHEYSARINGMLRDADAALQNLPRTPSPKTFGLDNSPSGQHDSRETPSTLHVSLAAAKGAAEHASQSLRNDVSHAEQNMSQRTSKAEAGAVHAFTESINAAKSIGKTAENASAGLASKAESLAKHGGSSIEQEAVSKEAAVFSDLRKIGQQAKERIVQAVDESRVPLEGAQIEQSVEKAKNLVRQGSRELEQSRLGRKVSQEATKVGDKAKDVKESLERLKDHEGNTLGAGLRAAQQFARRTSGTPINTPHPGNQSNQSHSAQPSQAPRGDSNPHMPPNIGQNHPIAHQATPHQAAAPHQPLTSHQPVLPHQPAVLHQPAASRQPNVPQQPPAPRQPNVPHQPSASHQSPAPHQPPEPHSPAPQHHGMAQHDPKIQKPTPHQRQPEHPVQSQPSTKPAVSRQPAPTGPSAAHQQQQQQHLPIQHSHRPRQREQASPGHPQQTSPKPNPSEPRQPAAPSTQPQSAFQKPVQQGRRSSRPDNQAPQAASTQPSDHRMQTGPSQPRAPTQRPGGHPMGSNRPGQQPDLTRPAPQAAQGSRRPSSQMPQSGNTNNAEPNSASSNRFSGPNVRPLNQQGQSQTPLTSPPENKNEQRNAITGMLSSPLHPTAVPQRGPSQYRMGHDQRAPVANQQDQVVAPGLLTPGNTSQNKDSRDTDARQRGASPKDLESTAGQASEGARNQQHQSQQDRAGMNQRPKSSVPYRDTSEGEMNLYSSTSSEEEREAHASYEQTGLQAHPPSQQLQQQSHSHERSQQQALNHAQPSSAANYEAMFHTFKQQAQAYGVGDGSGPAAGFLEQILQLLLKVAEDALPEIRRRLDQNNAQAEGSVDQRQYHC